MDQRILSEERKVADIVPRHHAQMPLSTVTNCFFFLEKKIVEREEAKEFLQPQYSISDIHLRLHRRFMELKDSK